MEYDPNTKNHIVVEVEKPTATRGVAAGPSLEATAMEELPEEQRLKNTEPAEEEL